MPETNRFTQLTFQSDCSFLQLIPKKINLSGEVEPLYGAIVFGMSLTIRYRKRYAEWNLLQPGKSGHRWAVEPLGKDVEFASELRFDVPDQRRSAECRPGRRSERLYSQFRRH